MTESDHIAGASCTIGYYKICIRSITFWLGLPLEIFLYPPLHCSGWALQNINEPTYCTVMYIEIKNWVTHATRLRNDDLINSITLFFNDIKKMLSLIYQS